LFEVDIQNLQKAIKDLVVMNQVHEAYANGVLMSKVPEMWARRISDISLIDISLIYLGV
jgi:hypothetical protein